MATTAAGRLIAVGTGKAISAWRKRAAAIENMKRFNQQRNR
jgi:type IV secretion system protein VirB6